MSPTSTFQFAPDVDRLIYFVAVRRRSVAAVVVVRRRSASSSSRFAAAFVVDPRTTMTRPHRRRTTTTDGRTGRTIHRRTIHSTFRLRTSDEDLDERPHRPRPVTYRLLCHSGGFSPTDYADRPTLFGSTDRRDRQSDSFSYAASPTPGLLIHRLRLHPLLLLLLYFSFSIYFYLSVSILTPLFSFSLYLTVSVTDATNLSTHPSIYVTFTSIHLLHLLLIPSSSHLIPLLLHPPSIHPLHPLVHPFDSIN